MEIKNICIIGLGYVGLTLGVILAERGFKVFGVEIKQDVVDKLNSGKAHFYEKGLDVFLERHIGSNLFVSQEIPDEKIDAYIISVGTPLDKKTKKPIMDYIIRAAKQVAKKMHENCLVVLRSTVPVGTTRQMVLPILKEKYQRVLLAFCPERTVEGKALIELRTLAQIIGGLNEESVEKAMDIFRKVTYTTIEVSSLEAAEMIKLIDNSFRDVRFSYANEIALICKSLGLDANEVIQAANHGYQRNHIAVPGYVAGPCLIKDPHILVDISRKAGYEPRLIKRARLLNEYLVRHTAERIKESVERNGKSLAAAKFFISGFAFKGDPETDDIRDSATLDFLAELKNMGAINIFGHDFIVSVDTLRTLGVQPCSLEEGFLNADCVLIMNNHPKYDNLEIEKLVKTMNQGGLLFDSWRLFLPESIKRLNHIAYESLGTKIPYQTS